ncbi:MULTISPECIES: hypothetical protein [Lysinibacillus]|uniref:Uncharacterized protein n=1 Tax=Lysinibacillus xylanilyticus TaxID=582475 RepID=A0ABV3W510_9BACI
MNIYPLYEFPPNVEVLEGILHYIDYEQPVISEKLKDFVGELLGKRPSRTNITIKELKKIGIIEGDKEFSLTWETQLYLDLRRPIPNLIIHLIHKIPELFKICKDICDLDPENNLSKPKVLKNLYEIGYQEGKLSTNREKLHGLMRVIQICRNSQCSNPFKEYEYFIEWLENIEGNYLLFTNNRYDENIALTDLKCKMDEQDIQKTNDFEIMLNKLYSDPVFSSFTSFSSVSNNFAKKGYIEFEGNKFYYLKLKRNLKYWR